MASLLWSHRPAADIVYLRSIAVSSCIGPDAWHRLGRPQPAVIDLRMHTNLELAGDTDDVVDTIHYGNLYKAVVMMMEEKKSFNSVQDLADKICMIALGPSGENVVELTVTLPEALLLADGFGLVMKAVRKNLKGTPGTTVLHVETKMVFVQGIKLSCLIGVNPHERLEKQTVVVNLSFFDMINSLFTEYASLVKKTTDCVEASSYKTIEALATDVAKVVLLDGAVGAVTVSIQKPKALAFVEGAGVEITRDKSFVEKKSVSGKDEL